MNKVVVRGSSYRFVASHFPPIQLFENLLEPNELEAAYALEALTNDRLRDEAGDISLVAREDRVTGPGTTAIMAAFTHIGIPSRFTAGSYGVYYAGLDKETAMKESVYSRARFLSTTDERPQILAMRCYHCRVDAELLDVTGLQQVHNPADYSASQALAARARRDNEPGLLYRSVRHEGGKCVALFKPNALLPPAEQAGHYHFHWDGREIAHVSESRLCF